MIQEAQFGFWTSPLTAKWASQAAQNYNFAEIKDGSIYWVEDRPHENGRATLMRSSSQGIQEMTASPYDVRSRVHEYGGKPYAVDGDTLYFVNFKNQVLYELKEGCIRPLTKGDIRLADLLITKYGIIAVAEQQHENFLALINIESGLIKTLASGHDFYAAPAISPDQKKLAWLSWNHPNMPWDGTELWSADFEKGTLHDAKLVAGGETESIFQPQWSPKNQLHYISDASGWWNLYQLGQKTSLYPLEAEFGMPLWVLGMSTYGFDGNALIASYQKNGQFHLVRLEKGSVKTIPFTASKIDSVSVEKGKAIFIAGFKDALPQVLALDLSMQTIQLVQGTPLTSGTYSFGEPITFQSLRDHSVFAFYYPPKNPKFKGLKNTKPPLIVKVHGGPTAACTNSFNGVIQYWTSRGFAVVDVNYGGSSGQGRVYRNLLHKQWGIIDIEDCEAAALHLIKIGAADPKNIFIEGASAGGYTALAALTFGNVFTAGASYYGISDLSLLAKETHKFESRYLDRLIGPYKDSKALYNERSPLHNLDRFTRPVIFFQGEEDQVVPMNQAKELYTALKRQGIRTQLVLYPGEHHGFHQAATLQDALEKELAFFLENLHPKQF